MDIYPKVVRIRRESENCPDFNNAYLCLTFAAFNPFDSIAGITKIVVVGIDVLFQKKICPIPTNTKERSVETMSGHSCQRSKLTDFRTIYESALE